MKITDIKQQVKRADRYSIFIDGKYVFSFSENELLNTGLRIGQEYTETELDELKNKAVVDKAYDRSLNLIMRRSRSEWELRDYLKRKEYETEIIDKILNKLSERGHVNDEDFACRWVENRRLLKATSKRRLMQELRQKRVSDDIIQAVLEADETDEQSVLLELIVRKRKQTKYQDDLKLTQYLVRQGYSYNDVKEVMATLRD
ncbi:MAG: RecX family transcriptional regulator [Patescibacteria group bacterium]